jgi:hypothetical protein
VNSSISDQSLPSFEQAVIDFAKFTEYALNPQHPQNQGKAHSFKQLGYDVDTSQGRSVAAQDLINQLRLKLNTSPAISDRETTYGARYMVKTTVVGPNGKTGTLVTIWQYDIGADVPRLVTNWLQVHV